MDRIRKTLLLFAVIAVPAAAHSAFAPAQNPCFVSGTSTFRLSPTASSPDYRVRIESHAARPDLRMQLVDRPEIADFVLVDDFGAAESTACRSSVPVKTVKVDPDARTPDVTVSLSADAADPENHQAQHRKFVADRDRLQPAVAGQAFPNQRYQ